MKLEDRAGVKVIAHQPNKKRAWNQCAEDERKDVAANLRIARHKKTNEHKAESNECVKMKERHRRIKRELNPKRERVVGLAFYRSSAIPLRPWEIFFTPMPKQD